MFECFDSNKEGVFVEGAMRLFWINYTQIKANVTCCISRICKGLNLRWLYFLGLRSVFVMADWGLV